MKSLFFTIALCSFACFVSFGQKKAVSSAKSAFRSEKPNFDKARTHIKEALEHPETANLAETWYIAGSIENTQFDAEKTKQLFGQAFDEATMYKALGAVNPFFIKADELDQKPDEKGKVKPKYRKEIQKIIYDNRIYFLNGGAYYYELDDYEKAYLFFKEYIDIPDYPIFKDIKNSKDFVFEKDSTYYQLKYYIAHTAYKMGNSELTIAACENAKNNNGYEENQIYQMLCYEYEQANDTINRIKTLQEGIEKFPDEFYFINSLINYYIYSQKFDDAIEYLSTVIKKDPNNPHYYDILGRIYENINESDKAIDCYENAIKIDPDYIESIGNLGRIHFNIALEMIKNANEIVDNKKYKEAIDKTKEVFRKSLPYLEKAHLAKPDETDFIRALYGVYYQLDMSKEFEQMEIKMKNAGLRTE